MADQNFNTLYNKVKQYYDQQNMSHPDRTETQQKVKDAIDTMQSMVLPQSPAELAMLLALGPIGGKAFRGASGVAGALASNDAESAFIGPKGIENLKKLGKNTKTFDSRFFGTRAEINPTDAANVWWRIGGMSQELDKLIKKGTPSVLLKDILPENEFPELFQAYPELSKVPVRLKPSAHATETAASIDSTRVPPNSWEKAEQLQAKLLDRMRRENPMPDAWKTLNDDDYYEKMDEYEWGLGKELATRLGSKYANYDPSVVNDDILGILHERISKKYVGKNPMTIDLRVPEQGYGPNPALGFSNSILHEIQHWIQATEHHGSDFMNLRRKYDKTDNNLERKIKKSVADKLATGAPPYPYTREALIEKARNKGIKNPRKHVDEFAPLRLLSDSVEVNESVIRNWMDSLTYKEKKLIDPWREELFWPPSRNQMEDLELLLDKINYASTTKNTDLQQLIKELEDLKPKYTVYDANVNHQYLYDRNPWEREAFEAAERDTNPEYRALYKRKTEK